MKNTENKKFIEQAARIATASTLIAANFLMNGCSTLASPLDQAYYTGGNQFSFPDGYTRTIFSTTNF